MATAAQKAAAKKADRAEVARATRQRLKLVDESKPAPSYADPDEVQEFAEGLPEEFLYCREMGHPWRPHSARQVEGSWQRIFKCPRCKTEKQQEITSWGAIVKSHYDHAEGYLHKGMGRIVGSGRERLRLESLTRMEVKTKPKKKAN